MMIHLQNAFIADAAVVSSWRFGRDALLADGNHLSKTYFHLNTIPATLLTEDFYFTATCLLKKFSSFLTSTIYFVEFLSKILP
jgi:hypothetical protein